MTAQAVRLPELDLRGNFDAPLKATDKVQAVYQEEQRRIVAIAQFEVTSEDEKGVLAKWNAAYRLVYVVNNKWNGDQTEERAVAFCQSFSLAHAWPYWRELLSSLSNRMGVPTILAPIFVVGGTQTHHEGALPTLPKES